MRIDAHMERCCYITGFSLVADKPDHLEFVKASDTTPLTPTGYTQPPTPDFPPPSPTTAMMGIEMKIQQIVSKISVVNCFIGCIYVNIAQNPYHPCYHVLFLVTSAPKFFKKYFNKY